MKFIQKQHTGKGYQQLIKIHKNNGSYENDVKNDKSKKITVREDVLNDLLYEQGHICAYCMRSINSNSASIEHIVGQSFINDKNENIGKNKDTDYKNMLAVCDGNVCGQDLHCDKSRANYQDKRALLFISPLEKEQMKNIQFSQSGKIYYKEPTDEINKEQETNEDNEIRYDLNTVLGLNCRTLVEHRGRTIKAVKSLLRKKNFNKKYAEKLLKPYLQETNKCEEFCQVTILELCKHI